MDRVRVPKPLAVALLEWHGGQGSSLYAVGSSAYAGRRVDTEDLALALNELEDAGAPDELADAIEEILLAHEEGREPDEDTIALALEEADYEPYDLKEDEEEDEENDFVENVPAGIGFPPDFDDGTLEPVVYRRKR